MNRGEGEKSGRVHLYERKKEQKKLRLRLRSALPLLGAHLLDLLALRNDATGGGRDDTFDPCLCPCKRGCMRCLPKSGRPTTPPPHGAMTYWRQISFQHTRTYWRQTQWTYWRQTQWTYWRHFFVFARPIGDSGKIEGGEREQTWVGVGFYTTPRTPRKMNVTNYCPTNNLQLL